MHTRISHLVTIFLFLGAAAIGQNQSASPYSRFGYGSIEHVGFGKNQAMGGVGIAVRSNSNMSPLNPASYSAIDTLSQIFELGLSGVGVQYKDIRKSSYKANMNFNYLGIAFPASSWWGMGIGVTPVSSVGYDYGLSTTNPVDEINYGYYGGGGMSKVFWGNSFELAEHLSLGVNFNYIFGSLEHYRTVGFPNNVETADFMGFYNVEKIRVSTPQLAFGLQYVQAINEKSQFIVGGLYELKTNLNATRSFNSYRVIPTNGQQLPLENISDEKVEMEFPTAIGAGLTYELLNVLQVSADYYLQQFGDAKYYGTDSLVNRRRIALGLEYTPSYNAPSYLKRIRYRLGGNISNNYQKIYGMEVVDFGITFGLGLPLGYSKTTVNLAFEYGKRGTTNYNLVREDYLKVVLNLSLNDVWFLKRKFK